MVEANNKDSFFSEFPITPQTMIVGALILVVYYRFHKLMEKQNEKEEPTKGLPTEDQALKLIMSRRTIMPKEYLLGVSLDEYEIDTILEAANWAPTHHKTEPWRFAIIKGSRNIERYLDFLEEWYDDHDEEVADEEQTAFKNKVSNFIGTICKNQEWIGINVALISVAKCESILVLQCQPFDSYWNEKTSQTKQETSRMGRNLCCSLCSSKHAFDGHFYEPYWSILV